MAKIEQRNLTVHEHFVLAAMQAMIQVKAQMLEQPTYDLASNREDCCGDIAHASIRVANETLKALHNGKD